jgi:hypothetical protein
MHSRRTWIVIVAVVGLLAWGGYRFWRFNRETRAEYHAAQIIWQVTTFVENNQGRWPRNWDELDAPDYLRDGDVLIDFSADPARLIAEPALLETKIAPYTGTYRVYPHAKSDLALLHAALVKARNPAP